MSALTGKQVLIVDDSRTVRGLLRRILTSQKAQVNEADSGESALERLKDTTYDLILL
ncbi:MAG TPA: response regulator, partial [Planctomycetaceae bacterium]|nr:response regulator [Planctomycetaceae bacterium]